MGDPTVSLLDGVARFVGTLGFPIAVAAFLLYEIPKVIDRLVKSMDELRAKDQELLMEIKGMRSDVKEMLRLLEHEDRFRRYGRRDE